MLPGEGGNSSFEHQSQVTSDDKFELLAAATADVAAWVSDPEITPDQLAEDVIRLRQLMDRLEVSFARAVHIVDDSHVWEAQGSVDGQRWVAHQCRMSRRAVENAIVVGERAWELPEMVNAVIAGRVGYGHLVQAAHTVSSLRNRLDGKLIRIDDALFLEKALESSVSRFWFDCQHIKTALAPRVVLNQEVELHEARGLRFRRDRDGAMMVRGQFDLVGGDVLKRALEPLARRAGKEDGRSREQRWADALVDLARHSLDHGLGAVAGGEAIGGRTQRPHMQVTTSLETLRGLPKAPAGELNYDLPISGEAVRRIACDCSITRVLMGADSAVIDVSHERRVVTPAMRKALEHRDKKCRFPGCDRHVSWTDAHHIIHWALGGPTDRENLVLLCWSHHFYVHEGGWKIVKLGDGKFEFVPPRHFRWQTIPEFAA